MKVKCPRCGREASLGTENPFRPFCSERCKLVDLGQWITGRYRLPVKTREDAEDAAPAPPTEDSQDP